MSTLLHDVRFALRTLRKRPGFAAVAVLTLALGVGANSAIFSAVHAVLLAPLPYQDADRLSLLWMDNTRLGIEQDITSWPNFEDWRAGGTLFEEFATYSPMRINLTEGDGGPVRIPAAEVSANFLPLLGVRPVLGEGFTAEHEIPGNENVVLLGHDLWQGRFGADPSWIGRTLQLNNTSYTVLGVLPPELDFPNQPQLLGPMAVSEDLRAERFAFWLYVVGKLRPGVDGAEAQRQMDTVALEMAEANSDLEGYGIFVQPLREHLVGDTRTPLLLLLGAVGLVLLIACANVANLLLARAAGRRREIAVRLSLGASRRRLVRQLLTESAVLALLGGALGLLVAHWGLAFLSAFGPDVLQRLGPLKIDPLVLALALGLSLLTGLLVGLVPALQASRAELNEALQEGGRDAADTTRVGTRRLLITAEVALTALLLIGAALLIQSFVHLRTQDPGFRPDGVVAMSLSLPASIERAQRAPFYTQLLERIDAVPGIEDSAAISTILLPELARSANFTLEGRPDPPAAERIEVPVDAVTPGVFRTLGIPLLEGRDFNSGDHTDAPSVVIVNRALAERFFPDGNTIGQRLAYGSQDQEEITWRTIVGVVGDARRTSVARNARPATFLPHAQIPMNNMTLVARATGSLDTLAGPLRAAVWDLDPTLPISRLETLEASLAERLSERRFHTFLFGAFAAVALFLAAVGIYGVLAQLVQSRTRELGIRMALGAERGSVVRHVLSQGLHPVLLGLLLALVGALATAHLLGSLLYGVGAYDPITFVVVPLLVLVVAVAACLVPALRASRVDPMVALRWE